MATNYLSKINLGNIIYSLKDNEARAAISTLETAAASSLVFKGVVSSATGITELTNYTTGWTYKATEIFAIADIGVVEPGDMIICINSNTNYSPADWSIVQNNVDVMTGATDFIDGTRGLVPAPKADEMNLFLRGDGTWQAPSDMSWGRFSDLVAYSTVEWGNFSDVYA